MSPPLLVLDGAPPSELKSGIVNSTRVRFRWQVLPSETKLRARSGVSPIVRNFAGAFFRPEVQRNWRMQRRNYWPNINARTSPDRWSDGVSALGSSAVRHRRYNPNA
jgi:hypothetical protein